MTDKNFIVSLDKNKEPDYEGWSREEINVLKLMRKYLESRSKNDLEEMDKARFEISSTIRNREGGLEDFIDYALHMIKNNK